MKSFLGKNIPSVIFVGSLAVLGLFLALLLLGELSEKQKLGYYLCMGGMFLVAISMYLTISKKNRDSK